jgi:hypothetical protein
MALLTKLGHLRFALSKRPMPEYTQMLPTLDLGGVIRLWRSRTASQGS